MKRAFWIIIAVVVGGAAGGGIGYLKSCSGIT
jgi:hypothetical protein